MTSHTAPAQTREAADALRQNPRACTPETVGLLLRSGDTRLRHLALVRLDEILASSPVPNNSSGAALWATLLPDSLTDCPPETAVVLSRLHRRLRPWVPPERRPARPSEQQPMPVRIAWLRTELTHRPELLRTEPVDEVLLQALDGLPGEEVPDPAGLVRELTATGDPALGAQALRITRQAMQGALLAPSRARRLLTALLDTGDSRLRTAVLSELAEPWAALEPLTADALRTVLVAPADPEPATAALEAAARHGHPELLGEAAADPELPPAIRRRALVLLGEHAERADIPGLLALAATDPLLLTGPAVECLAGLHRRGHFPADGDVPAVLGLALADHTVDAEEVAVLLYTCRHEALRRLTGPQEPSERPELPRRLELLTALAEQGAADLPAGETLTAQLRQATPEQLVPLLDALRRLRHQPAEEAVLAALPEAPDAALAALTAIGGSRTARVLAAGLGLPPAGGRPGPVEPWMRARFTQALVLVWQLTDDPLHRRRLLQALDPGAVPPEIAADLGGPDELERTLLIGRPDPEDPDALAAELTALARYGSAHTLPAISKSLLRTLTERAADTEPGHEPELPEAALTEIRRLGARLHRRRAIRPVCLLDTPDPETAGRALLATLLLDLLDEPGVRTAGQKSVILAALRGIPLPGSDCAAGAGPGPRIRARVHHLLRHRDRVVREQAVALLSRDADGRDARVLSAGLVKAMAAGDRWTVRRVLLALSGARARWAAPAVAAALEHPVMNVKKTAAAALIETGTPAVVPQLLDWLGRHDNPGLRTELSRALRAILGECYAATVLSAGERAPDTRTRDLLALDLTCSLSARAVDALLDQGAALGPSLLRHLADGRIRLRTGTPEELAHRFREHGLAEPVPLSPDERALEQVTELADFGWQPHCAAQLAEAHLKDPDLLGRYRLTQLRPLLSDWLELAAARSELRTAALFLAVRLAEGGDPWTEPEAATLARRAELLSAAVMNACEAVPRAPDSVSADYRDGLLAALEAAAPLLPADAALGAVSTLRRLPPAPGRPLLTVLRKLGAILLRADLDTALDGARLGADPDHSGRAALRTAFLAEAPKGSPQHPDLPELAAWHAELAASLDTPSAFAAFRAAPLPDLPDLPADRLPDSRALLNTLITAYPDAVPAVRDPLLDWLTELQPLGAPGWTLTEQARPTRTSPRVPHPADLDQPRSAALRHRLLATLDAPATTRTDRERRNSAALRLSEWREPETARAVARAFLDERIDLPDLALAAVAETACSAELLGPALAPSTGPTPNPEPGPRIRAARLAAHLPPPTLTRLAPRLLDWWADDRHPELRAAAEHALRALPPADLAELLRPRLAAGARGHLDLLTRATVFRTPELAAELRRLRADGHSATAARITLDYGPLRDEAARAEDTPPESDPEHKPEPGADPAGPPGPLSHPELLNLARPHTDPNLIRRGLRQLAEPTPESAATLTPEEAATLLSALIHHPETRIRLLAHRTARSRLDRPSYLTLTTELLDDPEPNVIRSAARTLGHAAWHPAVPALIGLLTSRLPVLRAAAEEALELIGEPAVPALRHTAARARPDRRAHYTELLTRITSEDP